ncbi:hypothetical protein J6590_037566 [Homalodisca vitripennis]|nr:hypothetical protein J6590_037566 [Homalodisca vitripennis]
MEENRGQDEDVPFTQKIFRVLRNIPFPRRLSQRIQWHLLWLVVVAYVIFALVQITGYRADHDIQSVQCGPHRPELSVDLTSSEVREDGVRIYRGIEYPPKAVWQNSRHIRGCPCLVKTCIRICDDDQEFIGMAPNGTYQLLTMWEPGEIIENMHVEFVNPMDIYVIDGTPDCKGQLGVFGAVYEEAGTVLAVMVDGRVLTRDLEYFDVNDYCLASSGEDMIAIRCVEITPQHEPKAWENEVPLGRLKYLLIISMIAMVVSLSIHLYLPQLRNLHGKLLVGFLTFLFVNYIQFLLIHDRWPMQLEYVWQYTYLGHLCWISTICFDVWTIICGPVRPYNHKRENILLLRYSLFACVCPAVLCGLTWATSVVPYRTDACPRPRFLDDSCRLTKETVTQVFYHVPIVVFAALNLLLYLFMVYSLKIHPKPPCTSPIGHASLVAKQGFQMYTKVAKVMILCGVCLLLMTTTSVMDCSPILRLLVSLYFSQGILVFAVLCCNVRTFKLWLQKRLESSMTNQTENEQALAQTHTGHAESSV